MDLYGPMKLPYDIETECSVLGTMINVEAHLHEGVGIFTTDHFLLPFHQDVFEVLQLLAGKVRVNVRILTKELNKRNALDHDGMIRLEEYVQAKQFDYWRDKLQDLYIRRKYREFSYQMAEMSINETSTAAEVVEVVETKILGLSVVTAQDKILSPQEAAKKAKEAFQQRVKNPNPVRGIRFSRDVITTSEMYTDGFPSIDKVLSGAQPGDLIIFAAQSGHGKTALAENIVRLVSVEQDYHTFYQNTEMNEDELTDRLVSMISGVDFTKIFNGYGLTVQEQTKVNAAYDRIEGSKFFSSLLPYLTPQKSRSLARKFKIENGRLDLLVIDYIGRLELEAEKNLREDQVLARIARESKKLAQELQCAVILLAQLNEDGKIEGARRIKNDADAVFFLEPCKVDEDRPKGANYKLTKYKVRRGDNGGVIWINFNKPKMYMTETT